MEFYHLHTFLTVAELGNISKASIQLYLNQSTVTSRIKELEKELGMSLFERVGRNIRLTQNGVDYLPYAKRSVSLMKEAEKLVREHIEMEGDITLYSISGVATYILPYWIEQFRQLHPGITIKVKTDRSRPIIDQVLKGSIDIGFVSGPVNHNGLVASPICSERIIPVVSPQHPWAGKSQVHVSEFENVTLIAYNRFSKKWPQLERWFDENGIKARIEMDLDHAETSKHMALNGQGVSFLPYYSVEQELSHGQLITFDLRPNLDLYTKTDLIYHRRHPLKSHIQVWVNFLMNQSILEGRLSHEH